MLLKKFRFEAKLSETQTVSLGSLLCCETLEKKFRFISLCFASKVSLRFVKKYVSLQSFASGTVSLRFVKKYLAISPPTLKQLYFYLELL